jgi:signal transduction histidine kinase
VKFGGSVVAGEGYGAAVEINTREDAPPRDAQYLGGMSVRAWASRWGDWAVAVALAVGSEVDLWTRAQTAGAVSGGRGSLAVLLACVTLPLAWRRRAPAAVLFAITGALVVASLLVSRWSGVPVEVFVAVIAAFYSVGAHCEERRALLGGAAALVTIAAVDFGRSGFFNGHGGPRPAAWLVFVVAWLVGRDLRRRRQQIAALRERAARLEREREQQALMAVGEERRRIARELHDVVAHSVSVMVVQAQAGPRLLAEPEHVCGAFRSIEASGREALVELRRLLGVLRTSDEQVAIGPQPGLGSLQSLVEQVREAGLDVELQAEGEPIRLPAGVDLSAYRIVQEALTNALKRAGEAKVEVIVRYRAFAVELEVVDNWTGAPASTNGSGHGLIGMRERVVLYGGVLEAGPRDGGGYAVRARLPLGGEAR